MLMKCELKVLCNINEHISLFQVDVGMERLNEKDVPEHAAVLMSFSGMLEETPGQFILAKRPHYDDLMLINKLNIIEVTVTSIAPHEGE
jgi:hypothetical protein